MHELIQLFITFAKIGFFSIGGGYAMIPFIEKEALKTHQWITEKELADIIALDTLTPGSIAVNFATFIGYKVKGITGAIVATMGVITPALLLVLIFAATYFSFKTNKYVIAITKAMQPAVVALILVGVYYLLKQKAVADITGLVIALFVFFGVVSFNIHPMWLVLGALLFGGMIYLK